MVIVGAGLAGLAAAWSARRRGHDVTIVSSGPGASALGGGAVDDVPWEQLVRASRALGLAPRARPLADDVLAFSSDLGAWALADDKLAWVATVAGRLRPARGRDRALLDLASLSGARVLLPRVDRPSWDADTLARGLNDDPFARAHRLTFLAADVPVLRFDEERRIADGDLALRHDAEPRLEWLAAHLAEGLARTSSSAALLGPWLGAAASQAAALSQRAGAPVGEALLGVGSPRACASEAARDRLLASLDAHLLVDRVTTVSRDDGFTLTLEHGPPLHADRVILALGGLIGGGLVYDPPDHSAAADLPHRRARPVHVIPARPGHLDRQPRHRRPHRRSDEPRSTAPRSRSPPGPAATAPARSSPRASAAGERAAEGITAAGDVVAGRPRTALEAVAAGIRAGAES